MSIMHASYLLLLQFFCSVYFLYLQVSFEIMSSTSHYLYYITIYIAVETIPRLRGCYAVHAASGDLSVSRSYLHSEMDILQEYCILDFGGKQR